MTTQALDANPGREVAATVGDVDAVIRRVVRALLAGAELTVDDLARKTGLSRETLFRRVRGGGKKGFTAAEVALLAAVFDLPAGEFYAPGQAFAERIRNHQ